MEKKTEKRSFFQILPPLRLFVFAFAAVMFVVMVCVTAVRAANDDLTESMVVMVGNCLLWLVPFVCVPLFQRWVSDGVYAVAEVFCFFASFLGTIMRFYPNVWWYDLAMHALFGYIGGIIGLFIACKLTDVKKVNAAFLIVFCFAVSLTFAALWEVFEFSSDRLLGNDAQGLHIPDGEGGYFIDVTDTMEDIICNLIGAIVFTAHMIAYVLSKKSLGIGALIDDFNRGKSQKDKSVAAKTSPQPALAAGEGAEGASEESAEAKVLPARDADEKKEE